MSQGRFKSSQAKLLTEYVDLQYGCALEYLWPKTPNNAIWRRGDNGKWFGVILTVGANKIMPGADGAPIEILDIRCAPGFIDFVVDKKNVFPGWHMNKRHWITIPLDGRMNIAQIKSLLDASYEIAAAK